MGSSWFGWPRSSTFSGSYSSSVALVVPFDNSVLRHLATDFVEQHGEAGGVLEGDASVDVRGGRPRVVGARNAVGGLRVNDGQRRTLVPLSRNSAGRVRW